jgi:nitronate monooxygenase
MDPADLPEGNKEDMDFTKGTDSEAKAWKDIWGAGQGVGNIGEIVPAREVVLRMEREYREALARVSA